MATSIEVKDELSELLTCPICLEIYCGPKYLPCLHTFCESCICTYIISSVTKEKDKSGFTCPVCRKVVSLQEHPGNPETWGRQLPINHLITSMMDIKDITRSERMYNACQLSSVSKTAVSWCTVCGEVYCTECTKDHRKFRMTLHHKIISIEELKSSEGVFGKSGIVFCDEHPDKAIEVFCDDHSKPCCTLCATINHRKCESVTTVDKATAGIKTATKTKDLHQKLQQFGQEIDSSLKIIENKKTEIETESTNIISEIDTLKSNIIKHLARMENELKEELSTRKGGILKALENEAMELTSLKCIVDNWKRIINTCIKHGSELQCLTEVNKLLAKNDEFESQIKGVMSKLKTKSLAFTPVDSINNFENTEKSFGSLSVLESLVHMPSVNMRRGKVDIINVFDVGNGNSGYSYGSGIFLGNFILVTNNPSSRVVKLNLQLVYQSELVLPNPPYDITRINDTKCAVGAKPHIIIIDVGNMQIEKSIAITYNFQGLQYVFPWYIVATGITLMWIDASDGSDKDECECITNYFYASGKNDYICAESSNSVSKYVNRKAKFTYKSDQLIFPKGIDVDYQGNIYIYGYQSKTIHQLTEEGELVRILSTNTFGISQPWIIRFETKSNRFLLTDLNSGKVLLCQIC